MDTPYTQCETCGVRIFVGTHDRNNGLCRICFNQRESLKHPRQEPSTECFDPLESDPEFAIAVNEAHELAVVAALAQMRETFPYINISREDVGMGFCHVVWRNQKMILRERFGLDWMSPAELNPHIEAGELLHARRRA